MTTTDNTEDAVEQLQELGLKEYEARCFIGLARLSTGTAKRLSEVTEVPRTRVYDAIRVLEAEGLVEVHHSSPQQYRAVPIPEAIETLRDRYDQRIQRLHETLEELDPADEADDSEVQEVWSMADTTAIESRVTTMVDEASDEVVFVVGTESIFTEEVAETLQGVSGDVDVLLGAPTEELESHIHDMVPGARTFVSGLDWLQASETDESEPQVGRLLLVDRTNILLSSVVGDRGDERAIYGTGFSNGLVVIARRIMAHGLPERTS